MGPFWGPILLPRAPPQVCSVLVIYPLLPRFCLHILHPCTHAILLSYVFRLILLVDRGLWPRVYSAGKTEKTDFDCCCLFSLLPKSNVIAPLLSQCNTGEEVGIQVREKGDRQRSWNREMSGITEQDDTKGTVRFHDFLFKSVQVLILTCYCFFSAGPTATPDGVGAHTLKLTLIYKRRREEGGEWKRKGKWESKGGGDTGRRITGTGTLFLPLSLLYPFSSVLFFNFSSFFCFLSFSTSADRDRSSSERL